MERLAAWAQLVSIVTVGVVAGIFMATEIGQVRVRNTLDARDFTLVKHGFEVAVGRMMPVLTIAAGVSIIPVAILSRSRATRGFAIAALALWVEVIVVTLVFDSPVNAESSPPGTRPHLRSTGRTSRDQWHLGQTLCTPLAVASVLCLGLAIQWNGLWS